MHATPVPANEALRLEALKKLGILDTEADPAFEALVQLASELCGTPVSLVSLIDEKRQWFKARKGIDVSETPRELAFCAHAVANGETLIVDDTVQDQRFAEHPLVTGDPNIRFYAGVPLKTVDGLSLGTLCVIDQQPRVLEPFQLQALELLAGQAQKLLELHRANGQLLNLNINLNSLLAVMAQDLRQPLGLVQCTVSSLRRGISRGETANPQLLDIIDKANRNAQGLIDDVLEAAELEHQRYHLPREECSLTALVRKTLERYEPLAYKNQLVLAWQLPEEPLNLKLNASRLNKALENLLQNAIKFTPAGGTISVKLTQQGDKAKLSVEDSGVGIPSELISTIFDKFTRARRQGVRGERSSGLGMHLTQEIIHLHGGQIQVSSQVGKGSQFWIELPLP